ncbi:hypothetical protein MCHI_001607 [Candidatus Magnetoovum chiemensis]|nr:hypothetical protein MCHI_001607 [Candidatus Magnetoovum chiemensis]
MSINKLADLNRIIDGYDNDLYTVLEGFRNEVTLYPPITDNDAKRQTLFDRIYYIKNLQGMVLKLKGDAFNQWFIGNDQDFQEIIGKIQNDPKHIDAIEYLDTINDITHRLKNVKSFIEALTKNVATFKEKNDKIIKGIEELKNMLSPSN